MATWAIGDVQGCRAEFEALLGRIGFDAARDRLWLVGDLVNRGPDSLGVLRLVRGLGDAAVSVLGNHDLHLLAIYYGGHSINRGDTFGDVLAADDLDELAQWLCTWPLMVRDDRLGYAMSHAGIPHLWTLDDAEARAREVEQVIRGSGRRDYFAAMYGNAPPCWRDDLVGMARWRAITNYFTRMRLVDAAGCLDFSHKGALSEAPPGLVPWYEPRAATPLGLRLVFGHWAALEGHTGQPEIIALDTGCVWGRSLTALCLDTGELVQEPAHRAAG
ncbi:MAG: symmetrical bis(5'-nucleosyl)-tetraphosphatase [Pseudomonadales bacterium]